MPLYDYACPKCGKELLDVLHTVSEVVNPSEETIKEITCNCTVKGTRMVQTYLTAPAIRTPTSKMFLNVDRKKRNKNHFKKEILPTLGQDEKIHHAKKEGKKVDLKKMGLVG